METKTVYEIADHSAVTEVRLAFTDRRAFLINAWIEANKCLPENMEYWAGRIMAANDAEIALGITNV